MYKKLYTACLLLNLFLLPLSTYGVLLGIASYFWDETEGVILSSNRVTVRTGVSYVDEALIEFTYNVNNIQYVSDIVSLNPRIQFKKERLARQSSKDTVLGRR